MPNYFLVRTCCQATRKLQIPAKKVADTQLTINPGNVVFVFWVLYRHKQIRYDVVISEPG